MRIPRRLCVPPQWHPCNRRALNSVWCGSSSHWITPIPYPPTAHTMQHSKDIVDKEEDLLPTYQGCPQQPQLPNPEAQGGCATLPPLSKTAHPPTARQVNADLSLEACQAKTTWMLRICATSGPAFQHWTRPPISCSFCPHIRGPVRPPLVAVSPPTQPSRRGTC